MAEKSEKYLKTFSSLVSKCLERGEYTITQAATMCDISYSKMQSISSGKLNGIHLETFVKVCDGLNISYLKVSESDTLSREEEMKEKILSLTIVDGKNIYKVTEM